MQATDIIDALTRALPGDPDAGNARRQVVGACFSRVLPTPVAKPRTLAYSREAAELLGLSEEACRSDEFAEVFAGNRLLPGMDPYAACYGGHQFGSWAGQLGDGRAITLGEVVNAAVHGWQVAGEGQARGQMRLSAHGWQIAGDCDRGVDAQSSGHCRQ